jgi:hypothetical protein
MANPGVILLWILLIVIIIGVIIAAIWGISVAVIDGGQTGGTGANFFPPCNENVDVSSLIQITNGNTCVPNGTNCCSNGILTSQYYIGQLGDKQYDFVVAPWGTSNLSVCRGYCTKYDQKTNTCIGANYAGKTAQENFDACMQQLKGVNCAPPIPVAAIGTTLYYPTTPTARTCI